MTKQAALYCRSARSEEGQINKQIKQLNKYCDENDITNFKLYAGDGESGMARSRPALDKLYNDISDGKINKLIVTSRDRISRDSNYFGYGFNSHFFEHDIEIVSLSGENIIDEDMISPFERLFLDFKAEK